MQGPVSNGTLFPPSASPSASKPPLSDDDMSDPEPPRPHLSPLSPRPRPSLAARSPDARPAALHPLQKLDGLLKSFADGLHSLEPLLRAAPDPALPGPSHAPAHPQNLPWPGISDIEREELVRLLLQSLNEIGYPAAAMTLQVESGFSLDPSPEITAFRQNVLAGNWRDVEALLKRELVDCCRHRARADVGHVLGRPRPPAASANGHDPADHSVWVARSLFGVEAHVLNMARFLVAQEKFLELLEARRLKKALVVLRNQIAPLVTPLEPAPAAELAQKPRSPVSTIGSSLNKLSVAAPDGLPRTHAQPAWAPDEEDDPGVQRLCLLSSLMMCGSAEEVREKADWEGVVGGSRTRLLGELQELIPPQKLLPHQRLPYLLEQAKTLQRLQCLYHMSNPRISLLATHSCSRAGFPSETSHVLTRHADEVWRIEWAHDGRRLASADRAKTCIIWRLTATGEGEGARGREGSMYEEQEFAVDFVLDSHPAGIGCIAWSPDDSVLLTGADCTITMWNTRTGDCIATLVKHSYDVSALCWLPDGKSFVSGGMDTEVMFWDLEGRNTFKWQVGPTRVVDLAVSPDGKRIVAIGKASVPSETGTASRAGTANGVGGESEGERAEHRSGSSSNHSEGHGQAAGMEAEVQHRIHVFNVAEKREVGMVVHSRELTCVSVSEDSKYALINHAPNEVLLYALEDQSLIRRFIGQKQGTFIIRSCFGGGSELGVEQRSSFVLSGSEDGKVYVWHLESGALIEALEGHDGGSVNAVAWNEKRGDMFASAGDDHTVRIWQAPVVVQRSLMDTMIATTRRTTSTILNSATRNSVSSSSSSSSTLNLATGTGGPEATVRGTRARRSLSPTGRKGQQGVQNGF